MRPLELSLGHWQLVSSTLHIVQMFSGQTQPVATPWKSTDIEHAHHDIKFFETALNGSVSSGFSIQMWKGM